MNEVDPPRIDVFDCNPDYREAVLKAESEGSRFSFIQRRISPYFKTDQAIASIARQRFGEGNPDSSNFRDLTERRVEAFLENIRAGKEYRELYPRDQLLHYVREGTHSPGLWPLPPLSVVKLLDLWSRGLRNFPNYRVGISDDHAPIKYHIIEPRTVLLHEPIFGNESHRVNSILIEDLPTATRLLGDFDGLWERISPRWRDSTFVADWIEAYLMPLATERQDKESENARPVGAIMASGLGSRIMGHTGVPKPLTPVGRRRLVDFTVASMLFAGIEHIVVAVPPGDSAIETHLRTTFLGCKFTFVESPATAGTGAAVLQLLRSITGPTVLATCDTVCPETVVAMLIASSTEGAGCDASMLVTGRTEDERPIWIRSTNSGKVVDAGKDIEPTNMVFGNIRWLSEAARQLLSDKLKTFRDAHSPIPRDSTIMSWMVREAGLQVRAVYHDDVIDVDSPADLDLALDSLSGGRYQGGV